MRRTETLKQLAVFRSLEPAAVAALDTQCIWRRWTAGQWILEYQDESDDVFFMMSGTAQVMIQSAGRSVLLREIHAGEFMGELAAVDGHGRSAGLLAVTDVVTARMTASVFLETVHRHNDVCDQLLAALVWQVRTLVKRVHEFSTLDIRYRVYAELLRLSRPDAKQAGHAIISPPPLHHEIAARVSTRRESVSRELKVLERAGLVERRRGALVLTDPERLKRMIDEAEDA